MEPYYQQGGITIYHGDCIDVLPLLEAESMQAVVTDPPFAFAGGISNGRTGIADSQFFLHWWKDVCGKLARVLAPNAEGFSWCDWRTANVFAAGFDFGQKYSWRVSQMTYHYREMPGQGQPFRSSVDMIAYLRGPKSTGHRIPNTTHNWISKYWYYGKHENHPAEKDPAICKQLIEWCSDPGGLVIDPFAGSGPVLIAARETGRRAIAIEIDERHCETMARRLAQEVLL